MPQNINYNVFIALTLGVSLTGIALILPLTFSPQIVHFETSWRKPVTGLLLAAICIAGISAIFFPEKCTKTIHRTKKEETPKGENKNFSSCSESVNFRGHHPDCGKFEAHTIHLGKRTLCAACTGLLIGAFLALTGTVLYFFVEWPFLEKLDFRIVLVGQIGVALGIFQFKFKGFIRAALNAFFVVGCYLILVGIDNLTENLLLNLYTASLIGFWLFTRISISQWDHTRICRTCRLLWEIKGKGN